MTVAIIITFCLLLLVAYVFDLSAAKTKIPAVILLLFLGWVMKQITIFFEIKLPDFTTILPVLGTIGLVLIVLEGSLELEFNSSKFPLIRKSAIGAVLPLLAIAFLFGFLFNYYGHFDLKDSLTNAIPFCIISSAIAIPSVRNLTMLQKEFVIYESSLSDIVGVILFNFLALNEVINAQAFGEFGLQLLIISVVSFIATIALAYLLNRIDHHIKFVPIILMIILIYEVCKIYHLPGLVFILLFGLFIGNLDELKQFKWIERFKPDELNKEVMKFKELTTEGAFIIRALFFLLFGYLIETAEVLNIATIPWAVGIVASIYVFRFIQLKISKLPLSPLLFVAPRGLITILLFISIDPNHTISLVNNSLIIQVILLTAIIMMIGIITKTKEKVALREG